MESIKLAGIYKLTSPSGKCYIGQSVDMELRISKYRSGNCKRQFSLYNALKKYGFENFNIEYLFVIKKVKGLDNILDYLETKYIKKYNSVSPLGYNLTTGGGNSHSCSEETKLKMSIAATGRKYTEEAKMNISLAKKGKKTHTEASKRGLSLARKGVPYSEETILKMGKHVICSTLYGMEFPSIKEAARILGIGSTTLCQHLKRQYPSNIQGLVFRYL